MLNTETEEIILPFRNYTLAVPLMNLNVRRIGAAENAALLRRLGAKRVFLALGENCMFGEKREAELTALKENCAALHAEGFEVGAWLWAFFVRGERGFARMEAPDGKRAQFTVCPLDGGYRAQMGTFLEEIAACGVDLIQFDDDLRYGFQDMGFGCACPLHRARMKRTLGYEPGAEELKARLLSGGGNPVRSAFVRANGEALETFAAEMRAHVDRVAPAVRLGFCACITSWDLDGVSPDRLSRILAGNTRPFYRLIGAPYWGAMRAWGNRLVDVIELERAEAARRRDPAIEIFSEGDTFPRPRYRTPAAFLECFDTALRADGGTDGILKYMADYTADPDYETGYEEAAARNRELYGEIDRLFGGKRCAGIRIWDRAAKYETYEIPPQIEGKDEVQHLPFSAAMRFAAANALPTVYEGAGVCGLAFGDDAKDVPEEALAGGLILDAAAARLLRDRGADVGLAAFGERFAAAKEIFADGCPVAHPGETKAFALTLSPGARILSHCEAPGGDRPLSYLYRNAAGGCFLVFAFESQFAEQSWMRCYKRAAQVSALLDLCGRRLPAFCPGAPELYLLAKTGGGRTAAGLWNLFPDPIYAPEVRFSGEIKDLYAVNCTARIEGDRAILSELPPFSCALLEATLKGG